MNILSLRLSEKAEKSAESLVETFLSAFVAQRFQEAAKAFAPTITWFGDNMDVKTWAEKALSAHRAKPKAHKLLTVLSPDLLARVPPSVANEAFEGTMETNDRVVLADIVCEEVTVTVGFVLRETKGGSANIARVFDPQAFKKIFGTKELAAVALAKPD